MQATRSFRCLWSIALETGARLFGLALLINRRFRGHSFLDHHHSVADDAFFAGGRRPTSWTFLPAAANSGCSTVRFAFIDGGPIRVSFQMIGDVRAGPPWSIIMVDTWMWDAPMSC